MALNPWSASAVSWRHTPTLRDRVQVVRLWSDLWGARLSYPVRAREGGAGQK